MLNKDRYHPEIEVFERLHRDLKALVSGNGPTEDDLAAAPILDLYEVSALSLPVLVGQIDGKPVDSTENTGAHLLVLHAPKLGWARTRSGYYRLGVPEDRKLRNLNSASNTNHGGSDDLSDGPRFVASH